MPSSYQITWKGPVKPASGIGIAGREYVRALRRLGVRVTVGGKGNPITGKSPNRRRVLVYHYSPGTLNVRKERKHFETIIVNTVWETTRIPRRWVGPVNAADAVCVPSSHNQRALRNSGVRIPIYVVPHGVHAGVFRPAKKAWPSKASKTKFTFVSVFGFQHRKNPEALLRAYWEEFSDADNVRLIIKTNGYAPYENRGWILSRIRAYKARLGLRKRTAPVRIVTGRLSTGAMRHLYAKGHAFVLPTRGEGVGLPFLEAMAAGLPVIATGWGGHMDFLNKGNAFLVGYRLQPPAMSMHRAISRPFRHLFAESGQLWAEADIGSLRRQMRLAYRNPRLCRRKGMRARRDALRQSWKRAGLLMKKAVETTIRMRKKGRTHL